jgi:hypothetical protein
LSRMKLLRFMLDTPSTSPATSPTTSSTFTFQKKITFSTVAVCQNCKGVASLLHNSAHACFFSFKEDFFLNFFNKLRNDLVMSMSSGLQYQHTRQLPVSRSPVHIYSFLLSKKQCVAGSG